MAVSTGSEEQVTYEEEWTYKFSKWEIYDDATGPSSSASPPTTDKTEAVEASEEESSDDDGEDDEDYRAKE